MLAYTYFILILQDETYLFSIMTQSVPHSKHSAPRLYIAVIYLGASGWLHRTNCNTTHGEPPAQFSCHRWRSACWTQRSVLVPSVHKLQITDDEYLTVWRHHSTGITWCGAAHISLLPFWDPWICVSISRLVNEWHCSLSYARNPRAIWWENAAIRPHYFFIIRAFSQPVFFV